MKTPAFGLAQGAALQADLIDESAARPTRARGIALLAGLALVIFLSETLTPLGFAHGMLYTPVILLAANLTRSRLWVMATVICCCLLNLAGVLISPPAPDGFWAFHYFLVLNRLVSMLVLGLVGYLCSTQLIHLEQASGDFRRASRMLAELRGKETLLSMAADIARFGGFSVDVAKRRLEVSEQLLEITGRPPNHQPRLEGLIDYFTPACREQVRQAQQACVEHGQPFDLQAEIVNLRKQTLWVRLVGRAERDGNGRVVRIHGAVQDITQSRRLEQRIQTVDGQFQKMANVLPVILWTADADGRVDFINQAVREFCGLDAAATRDDIINAALVYEEDIGRLRVKWSLMVRHQRNGMLCRIRIRDRKGNYRWHVLQVRPMRIEDGRVLQWCGIAFNIHALQEAHRKHKKNARMLAQIFESIMDMIFSVDEDWNLCRRNAIAARCFGGTQESLVGQSLWALSNHVMGSDIETNLREAAVDRKPVQFEAFSTVRRIWMRVNAYPLDAGLVICVRDITRERHLEEQLQMSKKMESIGLVTGGIAHDFNNLLTVVLGNAESIQDALMQDPQLAGQAGLIVDAASRGAELVRQLLAYARLQPLASQSTDINGLIENMQGMISHSVTEAVNIRLQLNPDLWPAMVDPFQLGNALINLAVNARQAMPGGGTLLIESRNMTISDDRASELMEVAPGDYVMLSVSDTGTGIAAEHLERIFEPFFTTRANGTGLGLSMVFGFVKQSGGHIAVYSELNRGTTFKIYLPRADRTAEVPAAQIPAPNLNGNERVLVVEDDPRVMQFVVNLLEDHGYQVATAANGREAIEKIRSDENLDLLLTDWVMPGGLEGPEVISEARRINPALKALISSGYTGNAATLNSSLPDGVCFLMKPYHKNELLAKVREALMNPY